MDEILYAENTLLHDFLSKEYPDTPCNVFDDNCTPRNVAALVSVLKNAIVENNSQLLQKHFDFIEQLWPTADAAVAGMLQMHLITDVFPRLEHRISSKEVKLLLGSHLLGCYNYYLILENNWLV